MPVRLGYSVAGVRSEEEGHAGTELGEQGPEARGWLAAKYCIYPQHVVLALQERTVVEKIQVGVQHLPLLHHFLLLHHLHPQVMGHPWATPTSIEIWLGDVPKGEVAAPHLST